MSMILIVTIFLFVLVIKVNSSFYNRNSICYKIIKVRKTFTQNIHYLPHSRCGISNHFIDLFQVFLLSLIIKRKLQCISIYLYSSWVMDSNERLFFILQYKIQQ